MDIQDKLYIDQMELWLKEQEVISKQLKRAVGYNEDLAASHIKMANLNREQLKHHRKRVALAKKEFVNWKKDFERGGESK